MNPLRSVGARLGLGLAVVVAAALVLVDLIVVPSLERNLIDSKVEPARGGGAARRAPAPGTARASRSTTTCRRPRTSANARVVYFTALDYDPPKLQRRRGLEPRHLGGRRGRPGSRCGRSPSGRPVSGTVTSGGKRYAEAATPCSAGRWSCCELLAARLPAQHQPRTQPARHRRPDRPRRLARSSAISPPRCSPAGSGGSSARPTGSPSGDFSRAGGRLRAGRARPARRRRSSGCASGSRNSSTRAGSSSPTPRTSCERRCSRSAASSS